ncbi:RNA-directed DNA polymerase, eukaryota [Tanacetum coccineum]
MAIRGVLVDGEWFVDLNEIKRAVWDCGTNKTPGQDGVTFEFFRQYWKFLEQDIMAAVNEFFTSGSIYKIIAKILANRLSFVISDHISDVQSAFITNRQILDGPFILNELLSYDYLEDVLKMFGFGNKWGGWINGCLNSAMGSVLVNRSLTSEFQFHKGLKQGDPLSPLLFIMIMDSLHLYFRRVMDAGLFSGIFITGSLMISNLFYADDAVFIGK